MFSSLFPGFPSTGVVVLAGVSGSGKSSWAARALPGQHVLSSDSLRGVLTDDENHQDCSKDAFDTLERLADLRLKYGRLAIIDATNLKRSARGAWLKLARQHHVPAVLVWFDVDPALCARRQLLRARRVPAEVIARQARTAEQMAQNLIEEDWDGVVRLSTDQEAPGDQGFSVELLKAWDPPAVMPVEGGSGARVSRRQLDIIGDVHGCFDELVALLCKLGYAEDAQGVWRHPEQRFLIFVGDLTDRGPDSRKVLELVWRGVQAGAMLLVMGNHDDKLKRWLRGNQVKVSHGLETTVAEFSALEPKQLVKERQRYLAFLDAAPLWALCDPEPGADRPLPDRLVVAHAAWKPSLLGANRGKVRSFCLYGPTSGTLVHGRPERLDWKKRYPRSAPLAVTGHTPYVGAVQEVHNTLCLDTACVFGGRLSALRWPEREIVDVPALKAWADHGELEEQPVLLDPDQVDEARRQAQLAAVVPDASQIDLTPPWELETIGPQQDFELRLDRMLARLAQEPRPLLQAVAQDEKLLRRSPQQPELSALVLANASKLLFTPEAAHQLYAKGLIYRSDTWQPVSVPYIKMYNYGERQDAAKLANELAGAEGVQMVLAEKLDGTMIQTFSTAGQGLGEPRVLITTRGVMEGVDLGGAPMGFDYLAQTRQMLQGQTPAALDPQRVAGLTLLWELIHPDARVVTDYGERREVVLTGVVDWRGALPRYLPRAELVALAQELGAPVSLERVLPGDTLAEKIEALALELEGTDEEGVVITFEGPGEGGQPCVLHRVKVKSPSYLRLMRLFAYCTYDRTREFLENNPGLTDWPSFKAFLLSQGSQEVPEEVLGGYRAHFEVWHGYRHQVRLLVQDAQRRYQAWVAQNGAPVREEDPAAYGVWRRDLALWVKQRYGALAWLLFAAADGRLDEGFLDKKYRGDGVQVSQTAEQLSQIPEQP